MTHDADVAFMRRAIEVARRPVSAPHPNPRVGCVVVKDGQIIAEGHHRAAGSPHAEVVALDMAPDIKGGTLYVTLEPCATHGRTPPCVERIQRAGISRVVMADLDPNPVNRGLGIRKLQAAGVQTEVGTLTDDARRLNRGFYYRHARNRPWVAAKLAITLDGRVATARGDSQWITGQAARHEVQKLRAQAAAIVTGVGTVIADDPRLSCRLEGVHRQPLRVIVDSGLRTPVDAKLFTEPGEILIAVGQEPPLQLQQEFIQLASVVEFSSIDRRVDCEKMFAYLADREINEVLVEAGPTLVGGLLQAHLIDEMIVYLAPAILGDSAMGMARIPPVERLSEWLGGQFTEFRQIGDDICLHLEFKRAAATAGSR